MSVKSNILLQMAAKLGTKIWKIKFLDLHETQRKTIFIGLDVFKQSE